MTQCDLPRYVAEKQLPRVSTAKVERRAGGVADEENRTCHFEESPNAYHSMAVVIPNTRAIALALFTASNIGFGSAAAQEFQFHCGPAHIHLSTVNDGHTIVDFKVKVGKTTRDEQYPVQFMPRYLPTHMWDG